MHGTNHIVELGEIRPPQECEDDGANERADKSFDSLFRGELDERGTPKSDTPDVSENVVADDEGSGDPEPNEAFKDIVDDEMAVYQRWTLTKNKTRCSYLDTTTSKRLMCTQQNSPNCCCR